MKTGNSDSYPQLISYSDGKLQITYDVEEVQVTNPDGTTRTAYNYKYIELENHNPSYGELVSVFINNVYPKDAELALINNELAESGTQEYAVYQELRAHAKELARQVLEALK